MITVALIDDHLIVRSGFAQLLGLEADLQVVAEFGSGREALAGLPGRGVQVCICDISMPDISGLELLSQLPKGMATIMLSVHDSPALVEQALEGENTALPTFVEARNQFELNYLRKLLQITKGNVTHAARMAGRNRTEFYKLLSRHELDANDFKE
ncbi:response regulator [Escherichia coli]|nr:response regulator [Escherichia coli]